MSVEELIVLAKALPAEERRRLVREIEEDRYTKMEREFAESFPPGFVAEVWLPDLTEEGHRVVEQELLKLQKKTA